MASVTQSRTRIASLLPSATEILFALRLGEQVVGVTHECDHPPAAADRPVLTSSLLPPDLTSAEIDAAVQTSIRDAHTIYALDREALAATRPDVIVTQELCEVCAVPLDTVTDAACTLPSQATVVASDPQTLDELFGSIRAIGQAVGASDQAEQLNRSLRGRLAAVRDRFRVRASASEPAGGDPSRVRASASEPAGGDPSREGTHPDVLVLEWPDPPWSPGHWVPDMVMAAGGNTVLGERGQPSRRLDWETVAAQSPDIVVAAFCGFDLPEAIRRIDAISDHPQWGALVSSARLVAVDGSAYFSRPGPRLIDGVELLAWIMHRPPELRPPPSRAAELIDDRWVDAESVVHERQIWR